MAVASGKTQPHCVCAGWGCRRARGWPSPQLVSVVDSFRKRTRPALSRSPQLQDVVHVVPAHRRSTLPQLLEAGQLPIDYQVSRRLPLKSNKFCQTGSRDDYAYGYPERTNYLGTSRVAFRGGLSSWRSAFWEPLSSGPGTRAWFSERDGLCNISVCSQV